jgi:hypothetical protein
VKKSFVGAGEESRLMPSIVKLVRPPFVTEIVFPRFIFHSAGRVRVSHGGMPFGRDLGGS